MSAEATFWAWQQRVKSTHKLVLLSLANCHNEANGQCNPSVAYIASATGLDRKTVMSAMSQMENMGLILRIKSTGSSTNYRLSLGQITSTKNGTATEEKTSTENGTSPKNGPVPKTDKTSTKNGTGPVPKTGPKSKKNLKESKSIGKGFDFSSWPTDPNADVLSDWKKVRKAPLTQSAVDLMAKELHEAAKHGYSVDHCLKVCCARGWRGFQCEWLLNHENKNQQSGNQPAQFKTAMEKRAERAAATFDYERATTF